MQPCFPLRNEGSGWHIFGLEKMGEVKPLLQSQGEINQVLCVAVQRAQPSGSGCGGHLWVPLERSFSYHTYITGWHKHTHTHTQTYWLHTHTKLQTLTAVFIGVGLLVLENIRRTWTPSDTSDASFPINWLQLWRWGAKIWCCMIHLTYFTFIKSYVIVIVWSLFPSVYLYL